MKLNIPDEILKIYDHLPDHFKIRDIKTLAKMDVNDYMLGYYVQKMSELGMVEKLSDRKWRRCHKDLMDWFTVWLRKLKRGGD